jgi:AmmeMemoRadiSam system protein B
MAGPTGEPLSKAGDFSSRAPAFAGLFYPADATECRRLAQSYVSDAELAADDGTKWLGGIVPHAGWICSAAIAAQTIATLARSQSPDVVVVFGAIHTPLPTQRAALDAHRNWAIPGGDFAIAGELQAKLVELPGLFAVDVRFHEREHAVEVELPLIRAAWPGAAILPVEVPVLDSAAEMGKTTARKMIDAGVKAVYLASSDMTHYGPNYRFTPAGIGLAALNWAKDNDRRLLDLVTNIRVERIVPEVRARLNACGGGAIAAMLAACREYGATTGRIIRHANSFLTLSAIKPQTPNDAVGYASVVIA